jgi:hypothetical protein
MVKNTNKLSKNANISQLSDLYVKCTTKHRNAIGEYLTLLTNSNSLLLKYPPEVIMDCCMEVLCADFEDFNPTNLQSALLELSISDVLKIKNAAAALLYYDAMEEDLATESISGAIKMFKDYLKRTTFLMAFLVLGLSTLSAQDSNKCKCGEMMTFAESLKNYHDYTQISDITIVAALAGRLNFEFDMDIEFGAKDLQKMINGEIVFPAEWEVVLLNEVYKLSQSEYKNLPNRSKGQ